MFIELYNKKSHVGTSLITFLLTGVSKKFYLFSKFRYTH